jgi:hypothetical protein
MNGVADLATKIIGVFAALLGLAGYVLVVGAAVLWLRLDHVHLPTSVVIASAAREELIATGAQAVAVWIAFVSVLVLLATWIANANGGRKHRRFGYREAALALALTVSTLLAEDSSAPGLVAIPAVAAFIAIAAVAVAAIVLRRPFETVATIAIPALLAIGLGFALANVGLVNDLAASIGATLIFGLLVFLTPLLQGEVTGRKANRDALEQLEVIEAGEEEPDRNLRPVVAALAGAESRLPALNRLEQIGVGLLALLLLGVIAVTSQINREQDFHRVLLSLTNGDCVKGTFIARGNEQIVIGQPGKSEDDPEGRISLIPASEVLETQVYGKPSEGPDLKPPWNCARNDDVHVHPADPPKNGSGSGG